MIDADGEKIGKIDELYSDEEGGQVEWALVTTGMFGTRKTFVPLAGAHAAAEDVQVPVTKQQVKDAPQVDAGEELSEDEERRLFEHYRVPYTSEGSTTAQGAPIAGDQGTGATTQGSDDEMTRSEEEVRVGTRSREAGRVRLRKYIVTEQVTQTGPVQREEVRLEREPITDANEPRLSQARTSQRPSTRSCCMRKSPSLRSGWFPRSACDWTPTSTKTRLKFQRTSARSGSSSKMTTGANAKSNQQSEKGA